MSSSENHYPNFNQAQQYYSHSNPQVLEAPSDEEFQDQDQEQDAEGSEDTSYPSFQHLPQNQLQRQQSGEVEDHSSRSNSSSSSSEDSPEPQRSSEPRNPPRRITLKLSAKNNNSNRSALQLQPEDQLEEELPNMARRTSSRNLASGSGSPDMQSALAQNSNRFATNGGNRRSSRRAVTMDVEDHQQGNGDDVEDTQQSDDPILLQTQNDVKDESEEEDDEDDEDDEVVRAPARTTRSGRGVVSSYAEGDDDEEPVAAGKGSRRFGTRASSRGKSNRDDLDGFVEDDEDDEDGRYSRSRSKKVTRGRSKVQELAAKAKKRSKDRNYVAREDDEEEDEETEDEEVDLEGSEFEDDFNGKRKLRQKKRVNYALFPPGDMSTDKYGNPKKGKGRQRDWELDGLGGSNDESVGRKKPFSLPYAGGSNRSGRDGWNGLPMSMTGRDYAAAFGEAVGDDSSDEDIPRARRNGVAFSAGGAPGGSGAALLGGSGAGNVAGAGGGSADALGRIKTGRDPLADVDPLGVDARVTFDSVGGLDGHISQLKEMVALPLLYPELFQRFGVTPPRGVLFHGPPGTGKTLVARALASSCSPPKKDSSEGGTGGTEANGATADSTAEAGTSAAGTSEAAKATLAAPSDGSSSTGEISFFMRKGADCLSKWVGEAERQLRLLFDEARACQPSIIFFDEIDGLAPVRSAKQDQIHASIVSTLLALMDGLDPRGQVVVIGATNRPDAIDPALRRPGRFDREFYFPLPDMEARRKIIQINTKKWEPPLEDSFLDRLAEVTKGYGGADIRALCTEAALSAIQRRYPQIYSTNERLLLKPESISVDAKDFMMSVSKLVPSSARSTSSPAAPLPEHFQPLLSETVSKAIAALIRVLPASAKRNALEEALWEDEPSHAAASASTLPSDGGFGREMLLQSFEALKIFRPRLLIHGKRGMGQSFVGQALLQHLEGYHVQALDLGSLLGDSARTAEAAVVQLFQEAKRHRPSIIFIPGLAHWAHALSESTKATVKALLDGLNPSDPVLLLAVSETPASKLPADVRSWFGYIRENRVDVPSPTESQRKAFFSDLINHAARPPVDFPDALPRRKKILEKLPIAPARAPRAATAMELQAQEEADGRTLEHLKYRLGPVLGELRKKYKRFTRDVWEEYNLIQLTKQFEFRREKGKVIVTLRYDKPASAAVRRRHSSLDQVDRSEVDTSAVENQVNAAVESEQDTTMQEAEPSSDQPEQQQMQMQMQEQLEPNGTSTANGHFGDLLDKDQAPSSIAPAVLNGPSAGSSMSNSADNPAPASVSAPAAAAIDPAKPTDDDENYDLRDLVIYTMTLEKMQKRLYHNGYLTAAAFMADLAKIVDNAEAAQEVDSERVFRAHQMRNLAAIMMDQYVDGPFRIECERMAERQEAREAKIQEAEDKVKAKANLAASLSVNDSIQRQSARVQGIAPEFKHPIDVGALERKRSRRGSSEPKDSDANKRSRIEGPLIPSPLGLSTPILPGRAGSPSPSMHQQLGAILQTTGAAPEGESFNQEHARDDMQVDNLLNPSEQETRNGSNEHLVNGQGSSSNLDRASSLAPESAVRARSITPARESTRPSPPPPFVLDQGQLMKLQSHILFKTSSFNTEQLEQLRATCFAAVWRRRAEYNRTALLREMWDVTEEVSCAVEDERRELEELEAENGY